MIYLRKNLVLCLTFVLGITLAVKPCLGEQASSAASSKKEHTQEPLDKKVKAKSEPAKNETTENAIAENGNDKSAKPANKVEFEPGAVPPLDQWVQPPEEKKPEQKPGLDRKKGKNWSFKPEGGSVKRKPTPTPKGVAPLSAQARALRLKMAKKYGKKLGLSPPVPSNDSRGRPDLLLCTVNVDGYRPKGRGKVKVTESSVLKVLSKQKCDIVALQGVAGRTYALLWDAIDYLADRLSKRTKLPYYGIPGAVGKRYRGSGFLINEETVELKDAAPSYGRTLISADLFVNKPAVVGVVARGRDGGERSFVLINFDLTTGPGRMQKDSVERKMLMAEYLRGYTAQLRRSFEKDPPTVVLLGNRDMPREAPAGQILSGRIRMSNIEFEECSLSEDKQGISCNQMPIFPQTLFGVFSDSLIQKHSKLMLKKWGRISYYVQKPTAESYELKRNERLGQLSDIYLFDSDLRLAWEHSRTPGRYSAGVAAVKNGLKSSPLVWTHLNW